MLRESTNKPKTVWHMYLILEASSSSFTIGIFENEQKGIQFIRSFGFKQDIACGTYINELGDSQGRYAMEFYAQEALEKDFLDMYTYFPSERGNRGRDLIHVLYLDEIELNTQVTITLGKEI